MGETDGCMVDWKKLVDAWKSGRNWWMHVRVEETGGCVGELKKLVDAWESGRKLWMLKRVVGTGDY